MFNKLKFNNLVISNKNGIQQSRIQTINKLVHKIRKLKSLLEKHPDNTKCKERIRKSTETMEILKKLNRVDMMKKLLLLDKPAAALITNGTALPEEIAIALLAMNKVMQSLVKRFKTELKIIELESDDWKQVLMESSKRKRKIERTEDKRRKRLQIKQQKAMGRKRLEWLEENPPKAEADQLSISGASISTIGDWQIEELSNTAVAEDASIKRPTTELNKKMKEKVVSKRAVPSYKQITVATEQLNRVENNSRERRDIKHLNEMNENFKMLNENKSEKEVENETSLVVDPFFITDSGENYLATAIKANESTNEEESSRKGDLHMVKLNKFDRKHLEFNGSQSQKRHQNRTKWESIENKTKISEHNRSAKFFGKQFTDETNAHIRNKQVLANTNNKNILHPSWVAKQKLKPIITTFEGKKTTFGDDLNKIISYPKNSEKNTIHPSWAAKQKLKPTIAAFQGKKITFQNDE